MNNHPQKPYRPISCGLHDRLEAAAVMRKPVEIIYQSPGKKPVTEHTRILDIQTQEKQEFAVLESGPVIRLDFIQTLDGVDFWS